MIQAFRDMVPVVHPSAYVHPLALVIGHVSIGANCYVGAGAVLRGDWGKICVEEGSNIQENCVVHMFPGTTVHFGRGAHIGHGAIVHGATVGAECLVGMNAVLLDGVVLGTGCIVGALALVQAESVWPDRSLLVGNPAVRKGEVSDAMLAHKREGTALYAALPADMHRSAPECSSLPEDPGNRPEDFPDFETWAARKRKS